MKERQPRGWIKTGSTILGGVALTAGGIFLVADVVDAVNLDGSRMVHDTIDLVIASSVGSSFLARGRTKQKEVIINPRSPHEPNIIEGEYRVLQPTDSSEHQSPDQV